MAFKHSHLYCTSNTIQRNRSDLQYPKTNTFINHDSRMGLNIEITSKLTSFLCAILGIKSIVEIKHSLDEAVIQLEIHGNLEVI